MPEGFSRLPSESSVSVKRDPGIRPGRVLESDGHTQGKGLSSTFDAKLNKWKGKKVKISNEAQALALQQALYRVPYTVSKIISTGEATTSPRSFHHQSTPAGAFRKLSFSAKRTMFLAQSLYEGVEVGAIGAGGTHHLYHDGSTRLHRGDPSGEGLEPRPLRGIVFPCQAECLQEPKRGSGRPRSHSSHINGSRSGQVSKLISIRTSGPFYKLIWDRFVASQMTSAVFLQTTAEIEAGFSPLPVAFLSSRDS